jgi:hypothetical protein
VSISRVGTDATSDQPTWKLNPNTVLISMRN